MTVSRLTQALTSTLEKQKEPPMSGEKIQISRTISIFAVFYEKVRTAMEYREDHLLRRAAIERILKRRMMLNENGLNIAEYVLKELLWAKYVSEDMVPVTKISEIQQSVDKFIFIRNEIVRGRPKSERSKLSEWILSTLAAEIEEKIVPPDKRDAFINYLYQYFRTRTKIKGETDHTRDIQVYIGVHRAFAKSDSDYIRYAFLKITFPDFRDKNWKDFKEKTSRVYHLLSDIDIHITHPISDKTTKALKRETAPFLILRDMYEENEHEFKTILQDEKRLDDNIDKVCRKRYSEIGQKLRRAGIRSIIYIFLTKMVIAFILEYPYAVYIEGEIKYAPLLVNILFPPFLMFLALIGVSPPGADNTKRIQKRIKEIVYEEYDDKLEIAITGKLAKKRPVLTLIFSLLYTITFFSVFGGIIFGLSAVKFSAFSQGMFLFFLSVVLFFAYRVRQTGKEYTMKEKDSFLGPFLNIILLPILNVGKWLSREIARVNFLVAVFDFIIEAPFKAIFEVFEEWFSFLRQKKEEL